LHNAPVTDAEYASAWSNAVPPDLRAQFHAEYANTRKEPTTGTLLAIFLGGLGIHRFYLNDLTGIVYIMFCWTFVPAIVGLIEAFGMSERVSVYNKHRAHEIASRLGAPQ
jgi:TM2 domain-containing membrane protein YozV